MMKTGHNIKILVTGAKGFIGKNLVAELRNRRYDCIYEYDLDTPEQMLELFTRDCDFVFHLAGVNRPQDESEFMEGNSGFTSVLLDSLKANNKYSKPVVPVLISSSIQAGSDNLYGRSKKAGEDLVFAYGRETGTPVYVYRLPNVFGKWCRPNYNSAVATFCHNTVNGLGIKINDPDATLSLVYIDDVVNEFVAAMEGNASNGEGSASYGGSCCGCCYCHVPVIYRTTVGEVAGLIAGFRNSRENRTIPDMSDGLTSKLYSTYLSYLPGDRLSYPLKMNADDRGSFTEFIRTTDQGQFSVNISRPGVTKGNHWHHTKSEKFLVVSGKGVIRLRRVDGSNCGSSGFSNSDDSNIGDSNIGDSNSGVSCSSVIEYYVSGDKLQVVDIPPGFTHNITNLGDADMVTIMWASECYDPANPDTHLLDV